MDVIPENKIMKFNPDTLSTIRKMYNLDKPGQIDEAIDLLEDWVKKQGHLLKKDYSREYLERAIIFHKGSVERAKSFIDNVCTFKTLMPNYFNRYDAKKDYGYLNKICSSVILPKLTDDNYRVFVVKFWNNDFNKNIIYDSYKLSCLMCEYSYLCDYCVGCIAVFDYRDVNLSNLVSAVNLVDLSQALTVLMKGYAYRVKGIHFLTPSKTIDVLVTILKKMLTAKISNRISVHTQLSSLHEHVPKEILPVELNGNEKSLAVLFDEWLDLLSTEGNIEHMREMLTKAVVDKSHKQLTEFKEIYAGLDGTFRTLSVD